MKVLVTGASGQLARSLAERARGRAGIELRSLGRPEVDLDVAGSRCLSDPRPPPPMS